MQSVFDARVDVDLMIVNKGACPCCSWRRNVLLINGTCPLCKNNWQKIAAEHHAHLTQAGGGNEADELQPPAQVA